MNRTTTVALAAALLGLSACGMDLKYLGDNLAGRAYMDGEPAPGYALVNGEYVPVEEAFNPAIDNAVSDLCGSEAAIGVRPHENGIGVTCVLMDGPGRTILVHDGVNVPADVMAGSTRLNGGARWNDDFTSCEIWLAPGSGPGTAAHEIRHCRMGHWHS